MENNGGLMNYYQGLGLRSLFEGQVDPCLPNRSFRGVLMDHVMTSNIFPSGLGPMSGYINEYVFSSLDEFDTGDCSTQSSFFDPAGETETETLTLGFDPAGETETETLTLGSTPDSTALLNPDSAQLTTLTNLVEVNYRADNYGCSGEEDMRFQNSALDSSAWNGERIMVDDVSSTHPNLDVAMYIELPNSVEHSDNQRPGTSSPFFGGNQSQGSEPESQISSSLTCTQQKPVEGRRDQTQEGESKGHNSPSVGGRGKRSKVSGSTRPAGSRVPCMVCLKTYRDKTALKLHMYIHTGERPFPCPICGKRFQQNGHLKKHELTHKKVRVF